MAERLAKRLANRRGRRADLLFCTALALLVTHELDAVMQAEWRLLPGLKLAGDSLGFELFVLLHVPLFTAIFWWLSSPLRATRQRVQLALSVFMLLHAAAHFVLSGAAAYTFHSWLSQLLIFGAALCAAAHLILLWRQRERR